MISRAERSLFSDWAWTVDRWLLASLALLIVAGLVFAMAGSPPVAERLHLPTFHFVNRQVLYLLPALVLMIATSFLSPRHVRRLALVIFIVSLALVFATIFYGQEVKGAKRWIFGVQPSEFLKPAFVVLVAWAFSEGARRKDVPGNLIALLLLPIAIVPLMLQPDFGQTMLISIVWAALFFMAGLHWIWVVGLGGLGGVSALLAYQVRAARACAHRILSGAAAAGRRRAREFSVGDGARELHRRFVVRQGARRRGHQAHPARLPHRFHLRGHRRGIRRPCLHRACRALRLRRGAGAVLGGAQRAIPSVVSRRRDS